MCEQAKTRSLCEKIAQSETHRVRCLCDGVRVRDGNVAVRFDRCLLDDAGGCHRLATHRRDRRKVDHFGTMREVVSLEMRRGEGNESNGRKQHSCEDILRGHLLTRCHLWGELRKANH